MRLKSISILALVLMAGAIFAADVPAPVSVAIFNFNSPYRVRLRNDIGLVSALLTANLSSGRQFTLVDRAELDNVMKEQAIGLGGEISPKTAAKIGQLVGAKVLVTGQIFSVGGATGTDTEEDSAQTSAKSQIIVIANVIGTETGRVFSQRVQGTRGNLVQLADDLSAKISETITNQYTNFVAAGTVPAARRIAEIIRSIQGRQHPAVSIQIQEQFLDYKKPGITVQTELGMIFKEAGFEVVDENSDKKPDILITGDAETSGNDKDGEMISCAAHLDIKAQDRLTGNILLLDRQDATGIDLDKQSAAKNALRDAADNLAERLLPALAKNSNP